jgi:Zn-dependent M28 family amino/carboxypeptidase
MNMWGRAKSVVSIALGSSTLDETLERVAAAQGRGIKPDPDPEKGYFYRSDHLELMRKGVPALTFLHSATDYVGKPEGWGEQKKREYVANDYHKVTDEVKPDWDPAGAVDDVRMLFQVGWIVAQGDAYPQWKPGAEFRRK